MEPPDWTVSDKHKIEYCVLRELADNEYTARSTPAAYQRNLTSM